jgi:hypothetical protein
MPAKNIEVFSIFLCESLYSLQALSALADAVKTSKHKKVFQLCLTFARESEENVKASRHWHVDIIAFMHFGVEKLSISITSALILRCLCILHEDFNDGNFQNGN